MITLRVWHWHSVTGPLGHVAAMLTSTQHQAAVHKGKCQGYTQVPVFYHIFCLWNNEWMKFWVSFLLFPVITNVCVRWAGVLPAGDASIVHENTGGGGADVPLVCLVGLWCCWAILDNAQTSCVALIMPPDQLCLAYSVSLINLTSPPRAIYWKKVAIFVTKPFSSCSVS